MHDQGETRSEPGLGAGDARSATGGQRPAAAAMVRAGQLVERNVLTLPAWFPAAKAHAVLRLKRTPFALLADARGAHAVVHADELATAAPERSLSGCATPLGPAISAQTPIDEALLFMNRHAALCLPVVMGGVVLGLLSRAAATEALAAQGSPRSEAAPLCLAA